MNNTSRSVNRTEIKCQKISYTQAKPKKVSWRKQIPKKFHTPFIQYRNRAIITTLVNHWLRMSDGSAATCKKKRPVGMNDAPNVPGCRLPSFVGIFLTRDCFSNRIAICLTHRRLWSGSDEVIKYEGNKKQLVMKFHFIIRPLLLYCMFKLIA